MAAQQLYSGVRELETRKPMFVHVQPRSMLSRVEEATQCTAVGSLCASVLQIWVYSAQTSVLCESSFRTRDTAAVCCGESARLVERVKTPGSETETYRTETRIESGQSHIDRAGDYLWQEELERPRALDWGQPRFRERGLWWRLFAYETRWFGQS
jgi:hypothetical protein